METARGPVTNAIEDADLVDVLAQAAFMTMGTLTRIAAENDLSLTLLRVLAILRDRRLRMGELVDHMGLEKSTLTGLVGRAEKLGLLFREGNPGDGRGVDVYLSEEGRCLAGHLEQHVADHFRPMTGALDAAERAQLHTLLLKMLEGGQG
jgi:DNA-binding MarR family transcriptional regulator